MKKYKITFISTWGDEVFIHMKAENKTYARRRFRGEMNPKCKIVRIDEVIEDNRVNHTSYETVNDVIAETWGIIEYEGNLDVSSKPHYEFITDNWVYEYIIVNAERVKETDKKLIPTIIQFEGEMCYAIITNTRRK